MTSQGQWRVGRSWGRTIVLQTGPEPTKGSEPGGDVLIGLARTRETAQAACDAMNTGRRIPGTRWWSSGGLIYDRPGASLTRSWIIAMFDPEQAQRIVTAVRGEP